MSRLTLPEIAPDARPAFANAAACAAWLATLPRASAAATQATLARKLDELNGAHVPAAERLAMLELLREPVAVTQAEQSRKYAGKPLPHSPQRREILAAVTSLWDALGLGYQRALQALDATGADRTAVALACHRAIDCGARAMLEHARAYVQPRPADLARLHRLYALAEQRGIAVQPVADPLSRTGRSCTVTRTYVQALLLEASSPRERRPEYVDLVDRWLGPWAPKVTVSATPARAASATPLVVDLAGESGASRRERAGPTVRYLEVGELSRSLAKRVHGLKQGKSPAELGLEGEITREDALPLVVALYRHWCEGELRRAHERRAVNAPATVCAGFAAAHLALGQGVAAQASAVAPQGGVAEGLTIPVPATAGETWQLRDASIAGVGLVRPRDDTRAARLAHGELLLVRPEAGAAMLAAVQWMQESPEGDLHVGARILPGVPEAVTARDAGSEGGGAPAIALSALPALAAPPSLVLRRGTFAPDRALELATSVRVRLAALLESGADFERAGFTAE
ncbi:MAG: hypothetical protein N2544_12085 [Burkholderiales bacterium]|nr:hypothetical protein [Burkholderiales bacterium]